MKLNKLNFILIKFKIKNLFSVLFERIFSILQATS